MTTNKRVLICLLGLVGPYLAVVVMAFLIGMLDGLTRTPYNDGQQTFIYGMAGLSIFAGIVLCPCVIYATRRKQVK